MRPIVSNSVERSSQTPSSINVQVQLEVAIRIRCPPGCSLRKAMELPIGDGAGIVTGPHLSIPRDNQLGARKLATRDLL
jgi:hypothetical protein